MDTLGKLRFVVVTGISDSRYINILIFMFMNLLSPPSVFSFSMQLTRILGEMMDWKMIYITKLVCWDNLTQARNVEYLIIQQNVYLP